MNETFSPGDEDPGARLKDEVVRAEMVRRLSFAIADCSTDYRAVSDTLANLLKEYFNLITCVVMVVNPVEQVSVAGDPLVLQAAPIVAKRFYKTGEQELLSGNHVHVTTELPEDSDNVFGSVRRVILTPIVIRYSYFGAVCMMQGDDLDLLSRPNDRRWIEELVTWLAGVIEKVNNYNLLRDQVLDPMTGMFNRTFTYAKMILGCKSSAVLSCLYVDIDNLAKIDDTAGHACGDEAILKTAQIITRLIADTGCTAGRYGGDEFVLLLPGHPTDHGTLLAERICAEARLQRLTTSTIPLTLSIGVCTYPDDVCDVNELIELAEHAMSYAKHTGKDRVCSISADVRPIAAMETDFAPKRQVRYLPLDPQLLMDHGILGLVGSVQRVADDIDGYNSQRSRRLAEYSSRIALALRLSKEHATTISLTAVLHGLGKLIVDKSILQKPAALNEEEWNRLKLVPAATERILEPAGRLVRVAKIATSVREYWDGSGYPAGLKGEDIALEARIVGMVDAYVAMSSERPYRPAMTPKEALAQLKEEAGSKWDARLVKLFAAIVTRMGE